MSNHLVGTLADVVDQREAISRAMGYPVRGRVIRDGVDVTGHPVHDQLPKAYAGRGTPGWCDYAPEIVVSDDATVASVEVTARAEAQLGKTVQIDGGKTVPIKARVDLVADAALPAKIRAVLDRRGAAQALETAIGIGGSQ